jgi:hypothetical protein
MGEAIVHHYLIRASEMKRPMATYPSADRGHSTRKIIGRPCFPQSRWTRIRWQGSLLAPRAAERRGTEEGRTAARLRTNAS